MVGGTVLSGDVESVSATEVIVRVAGSLQHFSRNLVKRMSFVEETHNHNSFRLCLALSSLYYYLNERSNYGHRRSHPVATLVAPAWFSYGARRTDPI